MTGLLSDDQLKEIYTRNGVVDVTPALLAAGREIMTVQRHCDQRLESVVKGDPNDPISTWHRGLDQGFQCVAIIGNIRDVPSEREQYQHHRSGKLFLDSDRALRHYLILATGVLVVKGEPLRPEVEKIGLPGDTLETWSLRGVPFYKLLRRVQQPAVDILSDALRANVKRSR